ncbi:hypothetical protein [Saccharolobus islandicus]|uniref:ATPase (AAA+ superfamily) n=2 Tax=Saccharolobus islandicus TaxID=43080 RepID=M9UCR3_SACIS|nr:hypothetical protein [Sulfolobus islandicus]ADX82284.1 hypothetical protein SiH_0931 [Sulfolobus islandicus HVE10/4]AGJ61945.1 Hypothetical Protein SiL_0473 [Sulfolobus islandicus LAL14/1]WCM36401.1 hypothetical protein GO599_01875 [Sulfolobus islandicus]
MACKIFDPYPKDSRENFYDRENIIDKVEKLVSGKFWPLLIGPKRVGKTSIVILAQVIKGKVKLGNDNV